MEFIERTDVGLGPIPIARCRELLGEEADTLTDQEVASATRPVTVMVSTVVVKSGTANVRAMAFWPPMAKASRPAPTRS